MAFPSYSFSFADFFPQNLVQVLLEIVKCTEITPDGGKKISASPHSNVSLMYFALFITFSSFLSYWVIDSYGDLHSSQGLARITHSRYGSQILGELTNIGL